MPARSLLFAVSFAAILCVALNAQSISYNQQIAPIFALHCNSCHSGGTPTGELDTSTHDGLVDGGTLGPALKPGDPENSILVQFIEGRRGDGTRMPLGGKPLTAVQIATIRQWITEGAKAGSDQPTGYTLPLGSIAFQPRKFLRISCRSPLDAYLTVILTDSKGSPLHSEHAAVKQDKDAADAGKPGDWITWSIWSEPDWPSSVTANVIIAYTERPPLGAECLATHGNASDYRSAAASRSITQTHEKDTFENGALRFWTPEAGDVLFNGSHQAIQSAAMQTVKSSTNGPVRLMFTPAKDQRNWFVLTFAAP